MLGELDAGRALFDRCVERFPHAGFAWIDAGICSAPRPGAARGPGSHVGNALALAAARARERRAGQPRRIPRWRDSGWAGTFDGTLVY